LIDSWLNSISRTIRGNNAHEFFIVGNELVKNNNIFCPIACSLGQMR
jgi:hypothetical protein